MNNNSDTCQLDSGWSVANRCDFVTSNSDSCEGGGYLAYTALVTCQDPATRALVLAGFILWLLFLFLSITVSADAFFSPNIAGIVSHLKISENIAGVTFMAFGNGAPDIFASLASVLGSDKPKVGLAIGGLVGAGIFVTTVVVGSMMLVKPFEVMRRPITRDICFYLAAVAFSFFVFLHDNLEVWMTIVFIAMYLAFAIVVITGRITRQRMLKAKAERDAKGASAVAHSLPISTVSAQLNGHPDIIEALTRDNAAEEEPEWNFEPIFANGYFSSIAHSSNGLVGHGSDDDVTKKLPPRTKFTIWYEDLLTAAFPVDEDEWKGNWFERIFAIIKVPIILVLKFTNPQSGNHWSKALAVIHCFTCPLFAVVAAQETGLTLFDGCPPLWALSLIAGIIPAILVIIFTNFDQEPRFFKPFSAFAGFLMAVFWIYSLANEVVGVLQMVGVVSGLSHEVLGLTLLAWSNSLGDLVADIAVARRGFPKMGISAAFGGPLFNLLVGVGVPFTLAIFKNGGPLGIVFSNVSKVLLTFLGLSLASSLVLLFVQRFYVHRWHGAYLLLLYVAFLAVILLTELGVIFKGGASDDG